MRDEDEVDTQPDVPRLLRRRRLKVRAQVGLAVFGFIVIVRAIYESLSP